MKFRVIARQTVDQYAEFEFEPPFTAAELASESEETLLKWAKNYAWSEADKHFVDTDWNNAEMQVEIVCGTTGS